MTTPPASAGGFSDDLRRNRPGYRLKAVSRPKTERPEMHDPSRRHIPVERAAAVAAVNTLGKRLGADQTAFGASLRSSARIDQNDFSSSVCSFVGEHRGQLSPRGIVNRLGQHRAGETLHVEVLQGDVRMIPHEAARELVQEVVAAGRHLALVPRYGTLGPLPAGRELRATRECMLATTQTLGGLRRPLRSPNRLARRERNEARQAHVDADRREGPLNRSVCNLDLEAGEPFAARVGQDGGPDPRALGQGTCHLTLISPGMPEIPRRVLLRIVSPSPTRNSALSNRLLA